MTEQTKVELKEQPKVEEVVVKEQPKTELIPLTEDGEIVATSLQGLNRACSYLASSGLLPKTFDTAAKVAVGLMMCKEMGLKGLISLRNIAVINGVPSIWGELPLAIARRSGRLAGFKEYLIDKDYNEICLKNKNLNAEIFAAVCEIKREGYEWAQYVYTAQDAAKNPNSGNQVWKSYRNVMMKRRARSMALKDQFCDMLGGVSIAEYDHDIIPMEGKIYDTTAKGKASEKASELNKNLDLFGESTLPPIPSIIELERDPE